MLYLDTTLWLPDDLLARGDKTSMAASLEARVPLLDHKLVEFSARLPSHLKVRGLTRKYLLKQVVRPWLPAPIVRRKKKGVPVPLSIWFRQEARCFLLDVLSPSAVRGRGLFDPDLVRALIDRNDRGESDCGPWLWALLNIELWYRQFIDSPSRHARASGQMAPTVAGHAQYAETGRIDEHMNLMAGSPLQRCDRHA